MRTNLMSMKKIIFAAFALFIFSQCTEEEIAPSDLQASAVETPAVAAEAQTGSMTISGVFTSFEDIEDCKTCTFVVPENASIVDGAELNLKAGAVVCLDKALRYGDVEFVNFEGTESNPIRIGSTSFNQ